MKHDHIFPPWNNEQIDALNRWQADGRVHPFTCGNNACRKAHPDSVLVATSNGWVCEHCDYTQVWAHDFMARAVPR